jgi:hypothetical protein
MRSLYCERLAEEDVEQEGREGREGEEYPNHYWPGSQVGPGVPASPGPTARACFGLFCPWRSAILASKVGAGVTLGPAFRGFG